MQVPKILTQVSSHHKNVYVKGGFVRDALLNVPSTDIDFLIVGDYDTCYEQFRDIYSFIIPKGKSHNTFVFKCDGIEYDVTVAASEKESVLNSDYTINSMLLDASGEITDYGHRGRSDLNNGLIRAVRQENIERDPIRAIRGIRFHHRFGFQVEGRTWRTIAKVIPTIRLCDPDSVSTYRSWTEMWKCFNEQNAAQLFSDLRLLGLDMPFGEFDNEKSPIERLKESLGCDNISKESVLKKYRVPMKIRSVVLQ